MKNQILILFIILNLFSCKDLKIKENHFYPYLLKLDKNSYLSYDRENNILFERKVRGKYLSKIHFLKFEKDTFTFETKKIVLPSFYKDFQKKKNGFIILNTIPRTLGKNNKSTDFITKYDEKFNLLIKKDIDISKHPNGNSFLVGKNELFYITDGVNQKKYSNELIISRLNASLDIINQNIIKRKEKKCNYNPIKCFFIEKEGTVIVSNLSCLKNPKPYFRVEMFDLNLNRKWFKDLEVDSIYSLGYSKSKNKIFLITKKDKTEFLLLDLNGKSLIKSSLNTFPLDITFNEDNIFLLNNKTITKIDFSGKIIDEIKIKTNKELVNRLVYRQGLLFLVSINNSKKTLSINKVSNIQFGE